MGTCAPEDVRKLSAALDMGDSYEHFGPLSNSGGLAGLNDWAGTTIDRIGNLAERNYSPEQVADHLRKIVAVVPSLIARIDCGADYEADGCVATVIVGEDRQVAVIPPQTDTIREIPPEQVMQALEDVFQGRTRW